MFALQLTETPVATGAKGPRAPEAPRAPAGGAEADFETHLGQARTAAGGSGAEKMSAALASDPQASDTPVTALPLERLSRIGAGASVPGQPGEHEAAQLDPVAADAVVALTPDTDTLTAPQTDVPTSDTLVAPEEARVAGDMEQTLKTSVMDPEAVPARTVSLDTETGPAPMLPGLSPSDIPDNGLPQPASGIPSGQKMKTGTDAVPVAQMPETTLPETPAADPEEMTDLPEEIANPLGLPLEADLSAQVGTRPVTPDATPREREAVPLRDASLSPAAEARLQVQMDVAGSAQPADHAAADAAFSRVLTEVSVASAPVTAPAQQTQAGSPAPQIQTPTVLDMSQSNWAEKLVEDVSLQPMGRGETLTLTLTPERLGTMQVRLEMQDGQTHVHFITDTPEAARLLTEAQPRLADLMSRAGVDLGSQSASTGHGSQQGHQAGRDGPVPSGPSGPAQDTAPETTTPPTRPAGSRSTVDVVA